MVWSPDPPGLVTVSGSVRWLVGGSQGRSIGALQEIEARDGGSSDGKLC